MKLDLPELLAPDRTVRGRKSRVKFLDMDLKPPIVIWNPLSLLETPPTAFGAFATDFAIDDFLDTESIQRVVAGCPIHRGSIAMSGYRAYARPGGSVGLQPHEECPIDRRKGFSPGPSADECSQIGRARVHAGHNRRVRRTLPLCRRPEWSAKSATTELAGRQDLLVPTEAGAPGSGSTASLLAGVRMGGQAPRSLSGNLMR